MGLARPRRSRRRAHVFGDQRAQGPVIVVAAVRAEQHEPGPPRPAPTTAQDPALLGADQLRERRPRAAHRAIAAIPPVDVGERRAPRGCLPEHRLERELEQLRECRRVVVVPDGGLRDGFGVPIQCVIEQRGDVELRRRVPLGSALARGSLDARVAQIAGEPPQLGGDVVGLAGQRAFAEERAASGDRLRGALRREIERDVGRRGRGQRREALVMECGDRTEARVLRGELSPAGASLVELELGRDG